MKQLIKAAKELNEVLGLEPAIKTVGISKEVLTEKLKEAAEMLEEGDTISKETQAVLDSFEDGALEEKKPVKTDKKASAKPASKKAPVVEEEDEDEEEEGDDDEDEEEEKPTKKAPTTNKKPGKEEKTTDKKKSGVSTADRIEFLIPLIKKGKHTKAELLDLMAEKFPGTTRSANQTILTDGKNEKYNKFPQLVLQDEKGRLHF